MNRSALFQIFRKFFWGIFAYPILVGFLSTPILAHDTDERCLAKVIYHEARDQSLNGQYQVGIVVINRVANRKFPNSVCGVVREPFQFTPNLDHARVDTEAWTLALTIAADILTDIVSGDRPLFFHSSMSKLPRWAREQTPVFVIDAHTFY